ncbi:valacyclovir hydrolase-like [Antedon mediterranea]|uniref:valacyclovir hydrolase-like n=1 Tax=Antedon mediterranea TaxID=105859 RepID=UPI003AF983F7
MIHSYCKFVKNPALSSYLLCYLKHNNSLFTGVCANNKQRLCVTPVSTRSLSTEPKSDYLDVDGVKLHYVKFGHGEHPLLLMPGALGSALSDFGPQLNGGFDPETYTVIGWDPSGYGKSRPPKRTFPLDFFQRDANHAHNLMQSLGYEKFSPLGWSDGGITALVLASQYPESLRKLVIWGANAFVAQEDLDMYEKTKNVSDWSKRMMQPMLDMYGKEYFQEMWLGWIECITRIYNENKGELCTRNLHKIRCPTLVLHGEKDPMVPKIHPGFLQQNIMGSRLIHFLDGKHNIHLRYAEQFNRHVDIFLRKENV